MREALIFAALAGGMVTSSAAQTAAPAYIGAGGCASSNCHGGTTALDKADSRILGNEYATWSVADSHARAYRVLTEARSKRMAEILKIADATTDKRCTVCHVAGSPGKSASDGVACEACHGPAEQWLGPHTRPDSHAQSIQKGMVDTKDLTVRAKTCLACHLGGGDRVVDHELIAAGHPDLAFELVTFTAGQPLHHREAKPPMQIRAWAVGQTVALAESLRLLAAHAEKSWPEFSDLECYQCHHDLRAESVRIQRGYGARRPGSLQVNQARIELVRNLVAVAAPEQRAEYEVAVAQLNGRVMEGPAMLQAASGVARVADALTVRFMTHVIDPAAVLQSITAGIQRIADGGVSAAEQATMTLDALGAAMGRKPEAVTPLYNYLEHPSLYKPAEFAAMFQKAARE